MSTEPSKSVLSIMTDECSEGRHESMFLPMTTRADRRVGSALAELGVPPSRRVSSSVPVLHVCMLPSGAPWDLTRWRCPRPLARARTSGFAKGGLDGRGDAGRADEQGRHLGGFGIPGAGKRSAVSGERLGTPPAPLTGLCAGQKGLGFLSVSGGPGEYHKRHSPHFSPGRF